MDNLLVVEALTKLFYPSTSLGAWVRAPLKRRTPIVALDNLSLSLSPGKRYCLMGPNGAGKTTLLKVVAGLILPDKGSVRIGKQASQPGSLAAQRLIGYVASDFLGLYDRLTGRQNLAFFSRLYGLSAQQASARITLLAQWLDLGQADQRFQEYSSGMKQRYLLAKALLHEPSLLLLDEPAKSLDPIQREHFYALLRGKLHERGITVVLTTHQAEEAEALADCVGVIHGGKLRAWGDVAALCGGGSFSDAVKKLCA